MRGALAAFLACLSLALAQPGSAPPHWASPVRRVVVDNGLTVLMLQRGTLPIVSVEALYRVGSRNERPGLTGAAHYIEHMPFRRTERINKGDLTNQVLRWGGRWGGYTSYDQTVYNAHAPSAHLEWLIFTERQRLQHVLFDAASVELERTSVISELRQYENAPEYTMAEHRLRRAVMVAHPYGSPIMGPADAATQIPEPLEFRLAGSSHTGTRWWRQLPQQRDEPAGACGAWGRHYTGSEVTFGALKSNLKTDILLPR